MENFVEMEGRWQSLGSFEGPAYPETSVARVAMTPEETAEQIMVDAKNKYLLESHSPPIVWTRHQQGFRIEDMSSKQYLDVSNIIMKYMPSDPLLKTITSPEAVDLYLSTLMSWYPKTHSLVALKEGSKELIGVLIGRLVVEDNWFKLLSEIEFVKAKDKYAYLKQSFTKDATDVPTKAPKAGKQRMSMKRGSKVSSKRQSRASGSRKSMGSKSGGQRKSMGAKGGGQRKSMGAKGGQRKSMGAKSGGQRKSMGGKRKSMGGRSGSQKRSVSGKARPAERKLKGDTKVPRPVDIIPVEVIPVVQAEIFDDDRVSFSNEEVQYMQTFKRKLAERFKIWMLLTQKMYYRVYLVVVSPTYERLDVERALFESLRNMCYAFNITAIAGVLTKYSAQNAFYNAGALIVYEVLYKNYPEFEPSDPKSYDRSAAVMFLELPALPILTNTEPTPAAPEIKPKRTRDK
uniref:Uncharacterized protein n=3 Tax=Lygus hesperus TaxID=30085 RepID=A0A0K8TFY2_LYGHE